MEQATLVYQLVFYYQTWKRNANAVCEDGGLAKGYCEAQIEVKEAFSSYRNFHPPCVLLANKEEKC